MKKSRIIALFLSLVMVVSLFTACGQTKTDTAQGAATGASTQAAAKLSDTKQATIAVSMGKDASGATKKLMEMFEQENPNIKVNYQEMPNSSDQQHNAYVTALSGGDNSVDIYGLDIVWTAEFANAGWVLPLDKYFPQADRDKFLQGPINGVTYKGSVYALPLQTGAGAIYYRKDLVQEPPKTWEELIKVSKQLMDEKKVENGYVFQGNQYEGIVCNALEVIWSNGGNVIEGDKVVLNSSNTAEGLKIFQSLTSVAPKGVTTYTENESTALFKSGKAAFLRNWTNAWVGLNANDSQVKGKVGIMPIPKGPSGEKGGTSALGGWNLAINKNSKNPDAAWKLLQFITSEKAQQFRTINGGYLPVLKGLYNNADILKTNPQFTDLANVFANAKPRPVSPVYSQMSQTMQIDLHKILLKEMEPKAAAESMDKNLASIKAK